MLYLCMSHLWEVQGAKAGRRWLFNATIRETVIAEITSNLSHANKPHQVQIDISTPDGAASGLLADSAVRCERLHTIPQFDVHRTIGSLASRIMQRIDEALKQALGIP